MTMKANTDLTSFTTEDNKYSWKIPTYWAEYDDDDEGTYAFFNTEIWTGNLRITPAILGHDTEAPNDKFKNLIEGEIKDNEGAIKTYIGNYECAHYKSINALSDWKFQPNRPH